MIDIEARAKQAMENFDNGYNCCQSVILAYSDITEVDHKTLATLSAPFGGGMGRLREVCGAVSGMFMVTGFVFGDSDPKNSQAKKDNYQAVQTLAANFKDENGSIICRELLGLTATPLPNKKKPCKELVGTAARMVGQLINQKQL
ncbi:MAG: C-GCAxxG-C-C family protein [Rikenellaceae bacterium]